MPRQATVGSTITVCENDIYLLGGMFVTKESSTDYKDPFSSDAYKYIIAKNEWIKMADLPQPVAGGASCSLGKTVYVSGGRDLTDRTTGTNVLYAFDIETGEWHTNPSMVDKRLDHVMEAVDNKLYVLGGNDGYKTEFWRPKEKLWIHVPSIEIYSIETQQWSSIKDTLKVHGAASTITREGKRIIIIGGFREARWSRDIKISHSKSTLDTEKDSVHSDGTIPVKTAHHFCCQLVVQEWWKVQPE